MGLALLLQPQTSRAEPAGAELGEYAGSKACAHCHTGVYVSWSRTRHSYSILPASAAREAGYPLPAPRMGGISPGVRSWDELLFTIGGRQRIAYADTAGRVLDSSFHHRVGRWSDFPAKEMDCRPCHVTGPGLPWRDGTAGTPAKWAEPNIGCEACHGPGAHHARSQEKDDIVRDPSSRMCGQCHTAAGRVLPQDDLHQGHDLVQTWNRDPHATGVRRHSHNGFCARCHSPFRGDFGDAEAAAERRLFSEDKETITCIACHDPHDLTNSAYERDRAFLRPPLPPKLHAYRGDDHDFAAPDYAELRQNTEVCVQCHRGADRIDLDHAHATCSDCHNAFARNRGLESRPFHDANHPRLSCRPCHRDADHLISIVHGDPDFLQPEHIHNLRTLPAEVIAKYGFRYPRLRRALVVTAGSPALPVQPPPADRGQDEAGSALRELLERPPHARLAETEKVAVLRRELLDHPQQTRRYLDLALAYAERGDQAASREILEHAAHRDSPWLIMEVPFDAPEPESGTAEANARVIADALLPPSADGETGVLRLWVEANLVMAEGAFDIAAERLQRARARDETADFVLVPLALAELGRGDAGEAVELLEVARTLRPESLAAPVALAFARLERGQFGRARTLLEETLRAHPGEPVAAYVLGRGLLAQRRGPDAVGALQQTAVAAPELVEAWFSLGDAYRMAGVPALAADAYGQAARRAPRSFEAQVALASALKWTSDGLRFQHASLESAAPPAGTPAMAWRQQTAELRLQGDVYAERALTEYARALSLRPLDGDVIRQVGEVYRGSGQLEQARDVFTWLVRRHPGQWLLQYRLGVILLQLGRLSDATAALDRARELAPDRGDVYFALGLALARAGRPREAVPIMQEGAIHEPFNPALYNNLGAALIATDRLDEARAALERALELATFPLPRLQLIHTNLGLIGLRRGDVPAARRAFRNALHHAPAYPLASRLLEAISSADVDRVAASPPVYNESTEIFGELTTVAFDDE